MADQTRHYLTRSETPLSETDIEEYLEDLLGAVLTSRRTAAEPAKKLSKLDRRQQDFALHWAKVVSKSNSEMAFQFVDYVSDAFRLMDLDGVTQWIISAMDVYDCDGLYLGSAALRDIDRFVSTQMQKRYSVTFEDIVSIMNKFVIGVSGRNLGLEKDEATWTDTETIYLPHLIREFESSQQNFDLYKAMVGYSMAQNRYGSFRIDAATGAPIVCSELAGYQDPVKALRIFEAVEELRLLARLDAEMPGLARQMRSFKRMTQNHQGFVGYPEVLKKVQTDSATVFDSLEAVRTLYDNNADLPAPACYQGMIDLEKIRLVTKKRVETERDVFRTELARLADGIRDQENADGETVQQNLLEVSYSRDSQTDESGEGELTITLDGNPVAPPDNMVQTAQSIFQDFGEIPEDYLVPAGSGLYDSSQTPTDEKEKEESGAQNGIFYDEWDYRRGHYRKNWCVLKETDMHPGNPQNIAAILDKYHFLIRDLRKSFEAIRGTDRMLRRQKNGDDIDIDAVVESYVDVVKGEELSDQLFIKSRKVERNLAVIFMVDVSGSTKGWINEAERESLVLLSEALETLNDRYAIYGFSGMTRKRCEVYRVKTFDEPYDEQIKARIAGMKPQDYTRMGVVIRHLCEKLKHIDAKTRVLITISDGKPDDYDGYRGEYGIEDTRRALMEAKHAGVHPFCITIDTHAHDYLPHMYGEVNYTVVSDVRKLPLKVSDIYRKLTT